MHLHAQDLAKQSLMLHCDAMKEQTIHAVLFIAFSFPYSVYFMPVYNINYKDLALICYIKRKQPIVLDPS